MLLVSTGVSLFANVNDVLRPDCFASGAALRVQKLQQFLQRVRVGRVAQESALPDYLHKAFILEFVQVMGKGGTWDFQFLLNLANNEAFRMRFQE
jgi:hypothetical protein